MGVIILLIQPGSWWVQNLDDGDGVVVSKLMEEDLVLAEHSNSPLITMVTNICSHTVGINSTVVG